MKLYLSTGAAKIIISQNVTFCHFWLFFKAYHWKSSNNRGKSCHYIKSTRGQLVFKMNFTGISCYLINHLNLTIWGLNKAQCQCWLLGTPNKEPGGGRGLMLHLPPLVCHWANITHHISVRICQFLPLCFTLQSPTALSRLQRRSPGRGVTGGAPVKNWEDFNTYTLLMMTGPGGRPGSNVLIWWWRNNYI